MTESPSIVICTNRRFGPNKPSCAEHGAIELADKLEQLLKREGSEITVRRIKCLGQCEHGPTLRIAPGGRFYHRVSPDDLAEIVHEIQRIVRAANGASGRAKEGE